MSSSHEVHFLIKLYMAMLDESRFKRSCLMRWMSPRFFYTNEHKQENEASHGRITNAAKKTNTLITFKANFILLSVAQT